VVALGAWARLDLVLELVPALQRFRYPVKAFFTVAMAASLLACAGADRLLESRRAWRWFTAGSAALAAGLVSLSAWEWLVPRLFLSLQGSFFAAFYPEPLRAGALRAAAGDAAAGAVALLACAGLGALVLGGRLGMRGAAIAVTAVVAADLLRAGAGLNPTAPASLYTASPEMEALATHVRQEGGRAFTCVVHAMPAYREAARRLGDPAPLWAAAVWRESLSPYANVALRVPTTGFDATAFASTEHSLTSREWMCADPAALDRLRAAAVRHVVTVQPFSNPELELAAVSTPPRAAPLSIFVYRLRRSLPDPGVGASPDDVDAGGSARPLAGAAARYLEEGPDSVRVAAVAPRDAWLILRRTNAPGWSATVNGRAVTLQPANGRHLAVPVPRGSSDVVLSYRVPGARLGALLSFASGCTALALWLARRRRDAAPPQAAVAEASPRA
jgi:hypothetical protein